MKATSIFKAAIAAVLTSSLAGAATAGELNVPNEFTAGNTASADEVNANFDAAEAEVGDNHSRINTLESTTADHTSRIETLEAPDTTTRSIHLPAQSFGRYNPDGLISDDSKGVEWDWEDGLSSLMTVGFPAPSDYAGGDVTATVMFEDAAVGIGVVKFRIRLMSFSDGEQMGSTAGDSGAGVIVDHSDGIVYGHETTIPASRLSGDYWRFRLNRGASGANYEEPVVFYGVTLEYEANP